MAVYSSTDDLYSVLKQLFLRMKSEDPDAVKSVLKSRLSIKFKFIDPSGQLIINGHNNPLKISFGNGGNKADMIVALRADTFHRIMLKEQSIKSAYASGEIKLKGTFWKSFVLEDILNHGQSIYPELYAELDAA